MLKKCQPEREYELDSIIEDSEWYVLFSKNKEGKLEAYTGGVFPICESMKDAFQSLTTKIAIFNRNLLPDTLHVKDEPLEYYDKEGNIQWA